MSQYTHRKVCVITNGENPFSLFNLLHFKYQLLEQGLPHICLRFLVNFITRLVYTKYISLRLWSNAKSFWNILLHISPFPIYLFKPYFFFLIFRIYLESLLKIKNLCTYFTWKKVVQLNCEFILKTLGETISVYFNDQCVI